MKRSLTANHRTVDAWDVKNIPENGFGAKLLQFYYLFVFAYDCPDKMTAL
jgi:hypothetical protein